MRPMRLPLLSNASRTLANQLMREAIQRISGYLKQLRVMLDETSCDQRTSCLVHSLSDQVSALQRKAGHHDDAQQIAMTSSMPTSNGSSQFEQLPLQCLKQEDSSSSCLSHISDRLEHEIRLMTDVKHDLSRIKGHYKALNSEAMKESTFGGDTKGRSETKARYCSRPSFAYFSMLILLMITVLLYSIFGFF